jgi:hypothetical protein
LVAAQIDGWEKYRNTTFVKDQIIFATGLKKSSTNEVHALIGNGLKIDHEIATYLKRGGLGEKNQEIQELEASYGDMKYKDFKAFIQDAIAEDKDNKPGPSKRRKATKVLSKPKRARIEEGSGGDDDADRRKKKERKAEKRDHQLKRLKEKLQELQAAKARDLDSEDLDK